MTSVSRLACVDRLKNQMVLVTGASSGIGRVIALAMADEGSKVVVDYISDRPAAEEVAREIQTKVTDALVLEAMREFRRRGLIPERSIAAEKIIFISSVHQIIPRPGHCNYSTSKGGLMQFMKSLAQEAAWDRIRINGIAPWAVRTDINRESWEDPAALESLLKLIPLNRIGEPRDIGSAAVWLASDESDYVHGATIFVDGGMALYPGFASGG